MARHSFRTSLAAILFVAAFVAFAAQPAQASGITCSAALASKVTPTTACEIGSTNNDTLGGDPAGYQVNLDEMFGFDDWLFAEKGFDTEELVDFGLTLTGDAISGTWSIDDVWTTLGVTEIMFVFKDGAHIPDTYVGYLLLTGATSGTYMSPFTHSSGSGVPTEISHISVYYRIGDRTVPEPSLLALLGLGVGASARRYYRRRRQAA
jgi:hypothetical protein